jgi:hypothetical protein
MMASKRMPSFSWLLAKEARSMFETTISLN